MKNLLMVLLTTTYLSTYAQDSISVLYIGNSYTYVNDLPSVVNSLTLSLGDKITYDSQTTGGATFATHVGNSLTYTKIQNNPWDFVVLQGQSQELSFPTSQVNTESLPYIEQLNDSVHSNNYCSQTILFMTWGRQNGDPQWDSISTYNGMQERLTNATVRMADSIEASVSAVGVAWKYVRDNYPSINLYSADGSHPSYEGTYLAACTFYASLFRKTPVGANYTGSLSSVTASILQNAAAIAVLDSLDHWNLHALTDQTIAEFAFTDNGNEVSFLNTSSHATTYYWNFGDGQTSTDVHPSHTYTTEGTFDVELIATDPCDSDTTTIQVTISIGNAGVNSMEKNNFILKNLGNDLYTIENILNEEYQLSIIDINGKTLTSNTSLSSKHTIDLGTYQKGIYYISLRNNKQTKMIKIIKN